jgi:tetrapyrrole methylase family protein/MazG family protein
LIAPALRALALDDVPGVQIIDAALVAGQHHPPINPDLGALLTDVTDLAALKRVLLNQYPGDHSLSLVAPDSSVIQITLERLDQAAASADTVIYVPPLDIPGGFERFQETIAHLRAPEGCPWDRKQTHESLRPYLLEETYEVLDALDSGDVKALREELGDLLLQIVLHSQVAVDLGEFRMADVIAAINSKIIRRHPHVWGTTEVNDDQDVKVNWDKLKQVEKNGERESRLDGVPRALPALSLAFSYQDRAARVGFDWETIEPVIAKLHEEIGEMLAAEDDDSRAKEVGDLLFAATNVARWLGVDPESALRGANARFYRRFKYIEQQAALRGRGVDDMSLAEMDALWDEAKANGL